MVFFRLSKLDREDKQRSSSPGPDPAGGPGSSAPSATSQESGRDSGKVDTRKKKGGLEAVVTTAGAPVGEARAAAGTTRSQAGLSVNDFISKTKNQQRQGLKPSGPELIAYARYLGIDPVADHDLLWIAVEALEAPLPSDWTEHFDSNDRVFYYNATTRVSSWTHPLEHIYRETYKTIVNFRNSNMAPPERTSRLQQLQAEVKQMHEDVHKEISKWSEHTDEQGNRFYFNREERQSTWTDPRPAKCQVLFLKQKMLKLLESNAGATQGFSVSSLDSKAEMSRMLGSFNSRGADFDDPASKRSKRSEADLAAAGDRRSPEHHSDPSDSDSADEKRKEKKKKKKKKKKADKDGGAIRLGAPQKLGTSQSEPSVGVKPFHEGSPTGPLGAPESGGGRSPHGGGSGGGGGAAAGSSVGGGGGAAPHPALGGLSPLDESGLSMAGRARVKAGIRLEPIGPGGGGGASPLGPVGGGGDGGAGDSGSRSGVRNSASVPAL